MFRYVYFQNKIRYFRRLRAAHMVLLCSAECQDVDLIWGYHWGYFHQCVQQRDTPKMPLKELEARFAKGRQKPFKLSDGGGLHLLVQPNGSKLWRLKYRFNGKERLLSFGKYPLISLAVARAKRDEAKRCLAEGIDPGAVNPSKVEQRHGRTFEGIARAWHENREAGLNVAHAKRVMSRMERDVFPAIGARSIGEITAPDILALIRKVEARGALDISRRLKQGIGQVFRFAVASGWADSDPTVHLFGALKPKPRVQHMARVPLKELPALVQAIVDYDGETTPRRREITRDALMFTLLTWARTSETRFATWGEFEGLNGPNPFWRIPPERMKMHREHLVPLSRQVVAILRARRAATNGDYVFPGTKLGQPISENTMIYACYRMGYLRRQTVHGFRGLASTWANEAQRYKSDWIELALAHADDDEVRSAYNSALHLSSRRQMLQDWADMIGKPSHLGNVTVDMVDEAAAIPPPVAEHVAADVDVGRLSARPVRPPYWQQPVKAVRVCRSGFSTGSPSNSE